MKLPDIPEDYSTLMFFRDEEGLHARIEKVVSELAASERIKANFDMMDYFIAGAALLSRGTVSTTRVICFFHFKHKIATDWNKELEIVRMGDYEEIWNEPHKRAKIELKDLPTFCHKDNVTFKL